MSAYIIFLFYYIVIMSRLYTYSLIYYYSEVGIHYIYGILQMPISRMNNIYIMYSPEQLIDGSGLMVKGKQWLFGITEI